MEKVKLGTICDFHSGNAWKADSFSNSGVPIIRINNLNQNEGDFVYWNQDYDEKYLVQKDDILLSLSGTIKVYKWHGVEALLNQRIVKIKPKLNVNIDWVYYKISHSIGEIINKAKSATIKNVSINDIKNLDILLPDLETQNKIVAILDKAKAILDKREATIKKYDELLRATFLEMFGDPILNPMGWNIKAFDKVGKFISGGTPDKNNIEFWTGNFPWVSPKDMKLPVISNAQDHVSEIVFNRTNLKRLEPNHLLIVVRGMILAHSFPTAINSVSVAINQDMKAILPFDDIGVLFLKNCLDIMKPQILNLVSTAGHGTKKFGSDAMSKLIIPIPPRNIQKLFENKARQLMKMSIRIKEYQNKTELLLKSLSQQVFSERITIDIDAELEALVNAIDLEKTDEQNKIETIINDVTFSQRLIDRLSEQQFEDKEQYDKAKYILFRIMKEEEGLVKQVFKNNEIQLTLQNETH